MIKWFLGLAVVGFFAVGVCQLVPVYMTNHTVSQIVQQVVSNSELDGRPKRDVLRLLSTRFAERDLDHLDPNEMMKVARDANGKLVLDVKYEERRKLMYNLEIVAGFDEQFTN